MAINDRECAQYQYPAPLLGASWKNWKIADLRLIIGHYRDTMPNVTLKINLMHELNLIIQEYGLQESDRDLILRARELGFPPPVRKPRVGSTPPAQDNYAATAPLEDAPAADEGQKCNVCYETLNSGNTPTRLPTLACTHGSDTCTSCLQLSISAQFSGKTWDHINCPSCNIRLTAEDVIRSADRDVANRCEHPFPIASTADAIADTMSV